MGLNLAGKYQRIVIAGKLRPEQRRSYIVFIPYKKWLGDKSCCEPGERTLNPGCGPT